MFFRKNNGNKTSLPTAKSASRPACLHDLVEIDRSYAYFKRSSSDQWTHCESSFNSQMYIRPRLLICLKCEEIFDEIAEARAQASKREREESHRQLRAKIIYDRKPKQNGR